MKMTKEIFDWVETNFDRQLELHKTLAQIPAPSGKEEMRVEFITGWLRDHGVRDVFVDDALNVICPFGMTDSNQLVVYCAHSDVVFPDMTPLPLKEEDGRLCCPGIGDDTAGVVPLMMVAEYIAKNDLKTSDVGVLIVINSCEEGLGNLKGVRKLFEDYQGRISTFVTLDSTLNLVIDQAVGSHRYEVTVSTEGGHSYNKFGNQNAIAELSKIINEIYEIKVPTKPGTKTTYNVGLIEGGTSVNTIAQSAKMLCEYRSDDKECLEYMEAEFKRIFESAGKRVSIAVNMVGDRPCSSTSPIKIDALKRIITPIIEDTIGEKVKFVSGSTDCNIPLSLGVAAICIGTDIHDKTHTREEWIDKKSILTGLSIAIKTSLELTSAV